METRDNGSKYITVIILKLQKYGAWRKRVRKGKN
jgi:hypothetical protein